MIYFNFPKSVYLKYREKINKTVLKVLNSGNYVKSKELNKFEKNFGKEKNFLSQGGTWISHVNI